MTVGELKSKLEGLDDDLEVIIPLSGDFDGNFYTPCTVESGIAEMGLGDEYMDAEDIDEAELLGKIDKEPSFILVPCGFFEENHGVPPELN